MFVEERKRIRNKIAKILRVKKRMVVSEANFFLDLGADFLDMKEIAMTTEDISGNDKIEMYVKIETVEDVFQLCGV